MRKEKMMLSKDNKGFSLVELIIVIAIMAILAAALAPQLMKYIEKSRKSTDNSTCASIKNTVNAALGEEDVYKECVGKTTTLSFATVGDLTGGSKLEASLKESLSDLEAPKESTKTKYTVTITGASGSDTLTVKVITDK